MCSNSAISILDELSVSSEIRSLFQHSMCSNSPIVVLGESCTLWHEGSSGPCVPTLRYQSLISSPCRRKSLFQHSVCSVFQTAVPELLCTAWYQCSNTQCVPTLRYQSLMTSLCCPKSVFQNSVRSNSPIAVLAGALWSNCFSSLISVLEELSSERPGAAVPRVR